MSDAADLRAAKIRRAELLEEKLRRQKRQIIKKIYSGFYPWQRRFNAATAEYTACALMAANQVGKSLTGCCIDAVHITGDYPEDWEGYRFQRPIVAWLLGYSGEKTRDLLQHKIFGRLNNGEFEGGLIPADRIIGYRSMQGTTGAAREITVRHASGGKSICQFWSYSQGQHALMGDVIDWYHIDEEPQDHEIFPQVVTRTLNGDQGRGGRGILTFTPENGKTQLVKQFMDEPEEGMYLQTATWDDAPHLSVDVKRRILGLYPPYQRDMRSKGVPLMGSGLIYEFHEDDFKCEPKPIPDHWFVINGQDFGWDHPQAHVQIAWDKDNDTFYVTHAYRQRKKEPFEAWNTVKSWSKGVPTAWPGDGLQHKQQGDGQEALQLRKIYEDAGFFMLPEHATFEEGGNGVWAGIGEIREAIKAARFFVFDHLKDVFEEFRQYHTKTMENGQIKIVKVGEDLLDAIRYAIMMKRYAISIGDVRNPPNQQREHRQRDWRVG